MQFQLRDPDKVGFIVVAGNTFTYDDPGPAEVDVKSLPRDQRNQLLYNYRRGVLACNKPEELVKLCEDVMSTAKSYSTPAEVPIRAVESPPLEEVIDPIEEDLKELRVILKQSVNTIKREVFDLPTSRLRKLLELEIADKNRKGLKTFLNEVLAKNTAKVLSLVGNEDVGKALTPTGVLQVGSKQVTDVVESDYKQVVLNPLGDAEDNGESG